MRGYTTSDVTIVVITVERPDYVEACLESLMRTTPAGPPLILFFNGTSDITRRRIEPLVERWPGEVTVMGTCETVPINESHQRALDCVRTPLVNFMGDDDIVLERRLPTLVDWFNRLETEPAVVTSWARRIAGPATDPHVGSLKALGPTSEAEWEEWRNEGRVFELLWPGAVLRTDLLRTVGFESAFSLSMDNRIFTKLAQAAPVVAVPDDGFGYRIHQASVSTSKWRAQHQHARYVARCAAAERLGQPEPSFDAFRREERTDPLSVRLRRELRSRSRREFRVGGELLLARSSRIAGFGHLVAAFTLWPPAFVEKLSDQRPRSGEIDPVGIESAECRWSEVPATGAR